MERAILHSDLNNFYASVECLYNPAIRNRPVAVTGDPEQRHGIVLAKNNIAKQCGVITGEPLWSARQKCKDIIFVSPHYDLYLKYSKMAKEIYSEYTDQVESFGLDEAWLDVTGSLKLFGGGKTIADEIRVRIKSELGVTASVGVSYNKIFAKLGSDIKKPDATTVITKENFKHSVWPLPIQDLLYVGKATKAKLNRYGIRTIGDLAQTDVKLLQFSLGKNGIMLWRFANGEDTSPVSNIGAKSLIKSIGNSTTSPRDLITDEDIKITMYVLSESVAARLREQNFICKTVQLTIRDNELFIYDRQGALDPPCCTSSAIFNKAYELYKKHHTSNKPIRSIGIKACNLLIEETVQLSIMPEVIKQQKQDSVERAMDSIRNRFGHDLIKRGLMLTDPLLSDLNPKDDHIIHPEFFTR